MNTMHDLQKEQKELLIQYFKTVEDLKKQHNLRE